MKTLLVWLLGLVGITTLSFGQTYIFPGQGGTGTETLPKEGQVLIGNSTSSYSVAWLTASSNITIATSSGKIEISATGASGITSLNSQTGATQTFATSVSSGAFTISSSGDTHTLTIPSNIGFFTNDSNYLTAAVTSLGGLTGSSQTFATSAGINISSSGSSHTFSLRQVLQDISGLSTTTGNLIVGSSTGFSTFGVCSNGLILEASSTAPNGVAWMPDNTGAGASINIVRITASQAITSASETNITGLSWAVSATTNYYFSCQYTFQSAAGTTGFFFGMNNPANPRHIKYILSYQTTANGTAGTDTVTVNHLIADMATTTAAVTASANLTATIEGVLENGTNAGTLQLTAATEVGGSAITIVAGSSCMWY